MGNLINKQDVVDAICEAFSYAYCDNCENVDSPKNYPDDFPCEWCHRKYISWKASKKAVEEALRKVPTVERKRGKWIENNHPFFYKCSECDWRNDVGCSYDYCPNCGADMRWINDKNCG